MLDWAGYNMVQGRRPSLYMLAISRRAAGELRRDIDIQYNGKPHQLSPRVHALAAMPL